jgi:pyrroline-5-carboxylate reductase
LRLVRSTKSKGGDMTIAKRIGVIVGNGWLGSALIRAAVDAGIVNTAKLTISSRSCGKGLVADIDARWTRNNAELVKHSDVVILSVRPFQFRDLDVDLRGKLALSVMAGVGCETIAKQPRAAAIVRAMPNAAAAIGQSFTPWFATNQATPEGKAVAQEFLEASGEAAEVFEESHIDYCAGLTGSGAAFPALLAEAMIAHATLRGISRDFAQKAARKVVSGASQLFAGASGDTGAIVKEMIDYKGIVAAALQAMLERGFTEAVAAGLDAAAAKAATIAST